MRSHQVLFVGLKLFVICAVAAAGLGLFNELTEPAILTRKAREEAEAVSRLITSGTRGKKTPVEGQSPVKAYYEVSQAGGGKSYILELEGIGYGGEMKIMAAYGEGGEILSVILLDNLETPGLGKKAEEPSYMAPFIGKGGIGGEPVPVSKEMLSTPDDLGVREGPQNLIQWLFGTGGSGGADAVSGATMTFMGVSDALARGSEYVKSQGGGR
jgi:electron transport complex protein RnfG